MLARTRMHTPPTAHPSVICGWAVPRMEADQGRPGEDGHPAHHRHPGHDGVTEHDTTMPQSVHTYVQNPSTCKGAYVDHF